MRLVGGCRGGGPGLCGRRRLYGERRPWVLVRDFGRVDGEVGVDGYCDGGMPRRPAFLLLIRPPFLSVGLRPSGQICGRMDGVWSRTGGNPWSSAAATTLTAPLIGVGSLLGGLVEVPSRSSPCLLVAKALVPLVDGGVLSSHPFLEASSEMRGSKVGACCLFEGGWWRLRVHLIPLVFVLRYRSSTRVWMCGWLCSVVRSREPCGCGSSSGSSCPGCSVSFVHAALGELSTFRRYDALRARARALWSSSEVESDGVPACSAGVGDGEGHRCWCCFLLSPRCWC